MMKVVFYCPERKAEEDEIPDEMGSVPPRRSIWTLVRVVLGLHTPTKDDVQADHLAMDDYELPRAEYPFDAPPEPNRTRLYWFIDRTFTDMGHKREFVRRLIDSEKKYSEIYFGRPVEDLAREVGLWDYYQSKRG